MPGNDVENLQPQDRTMKTNCATAISCWASACIFQDRMETSHITYGETRACTFISSTTGQGHPHVGHVTSSCLVIYLRLYPMDANLPQRVSFTVHRPTPVSRATSSGPESDTTSSFKVPLLPRHLSRDPAQLASPLARSTTSSPRPSKGREPSNSSDEESMDDDELITGFDNLGAQRCVSPCKKRTPSLQLTQVQILQSSANGERKRSNGPLVIPALKNKDWREVARKRRSVHFIPPSSASQTGKDGSVGGLGTRDTINSGPVLSGLQIKKKVLEISSDNGAVQKTEDIEMVAVEENDDQKALRAIIAEAVGELHQQGPVIDVIPTPVSEADALKQDVSELPESASLEDYERVPVSQFGAALLRGMGWKEGAAASRKPGKGLVEPYMPVARPALLGIGAKEQEVYDDGSNKNKNKHPEKRYVPVVKQGRSGTSTPNSTSSRDRRERSLSPHRSASRRSSLSPDRYENYGDGRRYDGRHDNRDRRRTDDYRRDRERRPDGDGGRARERRRDARP